MMGDIGTHKANGGTAWFVSFPDGSDGDFYPTELEALLAAYGASKAPRSPSEAKHP